MAKEIGKHVNTIGGRCDDEDHKHGLRKRIKSFTVDGGKLYYISEETCKGNPAWRETE